MERLFLSKKLIQSLSLLLLQFSHSLPSFLTLGFCSGREVENVSLNTVVSEVFDCLSSCQRHHLSFFGLLIKMQISFITNRLEFTK